jgi:hypothetical protein
VRIKGRRGMTRPAASPRHSRHKQQINGMKKPIPFDFLLMRVVSTRAFPHLNTFHGRMMSLLGLAPSGVSSNPLIPQESPHSPTPLPRVPIEIIVVLTCSIMLENLLKNTELKAFYPMTLLIKMQEFRATQYRNGDLETGRLLRKKKSRQDPAERSSRRLKK